MTKSAAIHAGQACLVATLVTHKGKQLLTQPLHFLFLLRLPGFPFPSISSSGFSFPRLVAVPCHAVELRAVRLAVGEGVV